MSGSAPLIGVTAATGQLGRLVVSQLKEKVSPENIIALVRSTSKASDLEVKSVEADYTNPGGLEKALQGLSTLLLISSSAIGERVNQHTNVIDAAKKAGVKHIVYTSVLHADSSPLVLAKEHLATENYLKKSGLHFTILRNGWYNENYVGSIPGSIKAGAWIGASGEGKISGAARLDYADAAVTVLTSPSSHVDKTYELAGDSSFTLTQLAAELSKQTGKTIPYQTLPVDDYAGALVKAGLPKPLAELLAQTDFDLQNHAVFNDSHTLSKLIGRPTTTLATTITHALKSIAN